MTFSENKSLRHPFQEGPAIHSEARKTWTLNSACSASPGQTAIISFFVELHIYMNLRIKTKFLLFVSSVLMSLMSCNTLIKSVMPFCCSSCYYRLWFKKKKKQYSLGQLAQVLGFACTAGPRPLSPWGRWYDTTDPSWLAQILGPTCSVRVREPWGWGTQWCPNCLAWGPWAHLCSGCQVDFISWDLSDIYSTHSQCLSNLKGKELLSVLCWKYLITSYPKKWISVL